MSKKESELLQAIRFISEEKGLSPDVVIETLEAALAAAYRKDFGTPLENITVEMDRETGAYRVFDSKTVTTDFTEEELEAQREELRIKKEEMQLARAEGKEVEETEEVSEDGKVYFNPKLHIMISEAKKQKEDAAEGDVIKNELNLPDDFGRMAAQTAKQVIMQKLREAERTTIFDEFKDKEGEIVIGVVQRREGRNVLIDIGRAVGSMPFDQQVRGERYETGKRIKIYVVSVSMGPKGPSIIVSRAHENIVKQLFTTEIPEIAAGSIEVVSVAREAGSRSKVAVRSLDENIDPIGSCVGQRGTRVQTIINELGGEKVDIIEFQEDTRDYIANALSPAKIGRTELDEEHKIAKVMVAQDQLSLAIGKNGQNVRLASHLTGWNINVLPLEESAEEKAEEPQEVEASEEESTEETEA